MNKGVLFIKMLKTTAFLITSTFMIASAYAGCAASAGFDSAMSEYNLAELSQSAQDNISELSKECKNILHTGKAMSSIGFCAQALDMAKGSS